MPVNRNPVLGQFSDMPYAMIWSANIRKLAKDHKSYATAPQLRHDHRRMSIISLTLDFRRNFLLYLQPRIYIVERIRILYLLAWWGFMLQQSKYSFIHFEMPSEFVEKSHQSSCFSSSIYYTKQSADIQLCDKSISRLRRHVKLSSCSLLMFKKL